MNKLLSAEFVRLFQSMVFRLCLLFSAGLGVFLIVMRWADVRTHPDIYAKLGAESSSADGLVFAGGIYLIFAMAVLVGVFVGTEYSDGTLRNKLTVGHRRGGIYLSKLIVCASASLLMQILYMIVALALGSLLLGGTTMKAAEIFLIAMGSVAASLAFTAILLLFSMLIQSKAIGSIVCLLATFIMLFAAAMIMQKLDAPEYYDAYSYVDEETGKTVNVEREKNPYYLTGTKRSVYAFLNDFLPISQMYQICMDEWEHPGMTAACDVAIVLAASAAGMAVFRRENLK